METKGIVQVCGIISGLSIERVSFANGKRMACNSFINKKNTTKQSDMVFMANFHLHYFATQLCVEIPTYHQNI
jgi:hypothetical protein